MDRRTVYSDLNTDGDSHNARNDLESDDLECDTAPNPLNIFHDRGPWFSAEFEPHNKPFFQKGCIQEQFDSGCGESLKSQDLGKHFQTLQITETTCIDEPVECRSQQVEPAPPGLSQLQIVYGQDVEGDTQLHLAIIQLLEPLCMYFINLVPHFDLLNLANDLSQTPLHLAVMTKMTAVLRRLIVAGADITCRDHRGDTPLHIASRNGDPEIVHALLEPVTYTETLQNMYKIPYQKIPQNLELRNYNGQTCLHVAADGSHIGVITCLLRKGANVNNMDGKSGRTVLHYAAETNNPELLDFLLKSTKVKVDARTYGGQTPLMLAQGRRHYSIVQRLMQSGAKFELPAEDSDSDEDMDDLQVT